MSKTPAAARIVANLRDIGITQSRMARILGVTQPAISRRYNGKVPFTVDELETVADALSVEPAALLHEKVGS